MIANAAGATQFVTAAVVVVGFLLALGSSFVVRSKTQGLSESVDALQAANSGLRDIIKDKDVELARKDIQCQQELHEVEVRCAEEVNQLKGKLQVVTGDLAAQLVAAAIEAARRDHDS